MKINALSNNQVEGYLSMLSCLAESASAGHADDCLQRNGEGRDAKNCQLCLDLDTADEMLALIEWD